MSEGNGGGFEVRALWCDPEGFGTSRESVAAAVERMSAAGINVLVPCLKGGGGVYWPSRKFPQAVADGYADFDLPAVLLEEAHARGVQVHAWFIDFMEGAESAAVREHPEWAALDPRGENTSAQVLRGKPYHSVWMCPARRPGYTDGWLVPLMAEFAERYAFDAIHHDYIRYPGDLAPDTYCFCDACLEDIPRFAGYLSESYPDEPFYHETYDRPFLESHWEQSPRVLPGNWAKLPRAMKARFLLEGSFFAGGRADLDYFFYLYRADAIRRFAREAADAIYNVRPEMQVSAALFKDPVHSGRFLGQDWRTFPPHVDIAMPMDYRDHYPGDFEHYLVLLAESIERQKAWAADYAALWPGIAVNFLYKEDERAGIPPEKASPERFHRTVQAIRATGVPGICLFSDRLVTRYNLWDAVREEFAGDAA